MRVKDFLNGKWEIIGPVLKPSKKGGWDDFATISPIVFKHPLKAGAIMYYQGQSYNSRDWRIGVAESAKIIRWKKIQDNPIIDYKDKKKIYQTDAAYLFKYKGNYYLFCEERMYERTSQHNIKDSIKILVPPFLRKILWKIDRIRKDKLKISKYIEHSSNRYVIRFSSNNPLKWDINSRIVIGTKRGLGVDICSPKIYNFHGKYHLLCGVFDGKKTKTALTPVKNPLDLKGIRLNIILEPGKKGDWDEDGVIMASILEVDDGYVGFYEACNSKKTYRIGMAYSYDLKEWKKFEGNPVIDIGERGSFYDRMIVAPYIFQDKKKIHLFFSAYDWRMNNCIAVAELKKR